MMLDYSYWALCSAGIITIISYSTGREKYKTATVQESDQHRKEKEDKQANHTVRIHSTRAEKLAPKMRVEIDICAPL